MATRKVTKKIVTNEKNADSRGDGALRTLWGIACFGLAALLVYFLYAKPQENAVDIVRQVMLGLMGKCAILLPLTAVWIGVMMFSLKARRVSPAQVSLIALAMLMICALFHLPSSAYIFDYTKFPNFINFTAQSYRFGASERAGAGVFGALMTYPLYSGLGVAASALILSVALMSTLVAAFRLSLPDMARGAKQWYADRRAVKQYEGIPQRNIPYQPAQDLAAFLDAPPKERARRKDVEMPWDQPGYQTAPIQPSDIDKDAIDVPSFLSATRKPSDRLKRRTPKEIEDTTPPTDPPVKVTAKKVKKAAQRVKDDEVIAEISAAKQGTHAPSDTMYHYPPIDLLSEPIQDISDEENAEVDAARGKRLLEMLESFGIQARISHVSHGPAITRFELQPAPGIKVSRIVGLQDNIALTLAATSVRIEAPIPGKAALGVEVPNEKVSIVPLRTILESRAARKHPSKLAFGLGMDNAGECIIADIASMPHILIAGSTGSGKSVCINTIIASILYRATPEEVRMIMIDPKMVELSVYNGIPHLLIPVVTDAKKAAGALQWAVVEMQERYKKFSDRGVRDMKGYNSVLEEGETPLPQILVIIDELADLMMVAPGEVEEAICRLAQLARAAGIHLVIATQRPSVNFITGAIKANIPSRIAFAVASQIDSRTILDIGGAEKLLGKGDMLYAPLGLSKPMRVQGAFVPDREVHAVAKYVMQRQTAEYDASFIEQLDAITTPGSAVTDSLEGLDELLPQAIDMALEAGQISISMLQRRMRIGYARAGRLVDDLTQRGYLAPAEGSKPRDVLITREQFNQLFPK